MTLATVNLTRLDPRRHLLDRAMRLALVACAAVSVGVLVALVGLLIQKGLPHLDWEFLTNGPSSRPQRAGAYHAIIGTVWVGAVSMLFAIPVGVMAAVYLNEFARGNAVTSLLRASIANLAGVPSVVFGLLGLALFVRAMSLGKSILSAGLTLALLTLPIIIVVAEEALKTVPMSLREAAFGLGATKWQVVRHHVLPYALPGILTGSILALSRSMGETAPLIVIGAATYLRATPPGPIACATDPIGCPTILQEGFTSPFTALPIQSYYWAQESRLEFHDLAWAAVLLLLAITFLGNLVAIVVRDRYQRKYRW